MHMAMIAIFSLDREVCVDVWPVEVIDAEGVTGVCIIFKSLSFQNVSHINFIRTRIVVDHPIITGF
jgi:hypothetical protein